MLSEIKIEERTYTNYLEVTGLTENIIWRLMNKNPTIYINNNIEVHSSQIHGLGCFAKRDYLPNEIIGEVLVDDKRTELGRYVNHSSTPNVYLKENHFHTIRNLKRDDEIVVDYFSNLQTLIDAANK
jgi:SET domain-containing protein